ncbi:AfsR/SARP family transcriptional regulator [Cryptosporangium phraense]|uniref:AfsR/SARP family transcriptional regulator n=1 Tax=Cryptosporangium phraense TaxID=2593070 RepID=UPI00197A90AA|nr:winged helix-turn-helix domain-containing protein [Cryptosporangium phraense]
MSGPALRFQILGPLRVWRGDVELDAGPRQQALLLALLLANYGRPVSTSELIGLIWDDDAPASAVNVVQKYAGALRRLLEPGRPSYDAGSYLRRRGNGYLFVADSGTLDLAAFREDPAASVGLWRGPAGDGLNYGPTAAAVFAALNDEFFDACVAAAGAGRQVRRGHARRGQARPAAALARQPDPRRPATAKAQPEAAAATATPTAATATAPAAAGAGAAEVAAAEVAAGVDAEVAAAAGAPAAGAPAVEARRRRPKAAEVGAAAAGLVLAAQAQLTAAPAMRSGYAPRPPTSSTAPKRSPECSRPTSWPPAGAWPARPSPPRTSRSRH